MKTIIFLKNRSNKKCVENFDLSNGINKSISHFHETIPLNDWYVLAVPARQCCGELPHTVYSPAVFPTLKRRDTTPRTSKGENSL
jgi:hypothetical protein